MAAEIKRARAPHAPGAEQDCGPYYDDGDVGIFADGGVGGHGARRLPPGRRPEAAAPNVVGPPASTHSAPPTTI